MFPLYGTEYIGPRVCVHLYFLKGEVVMCKYFTIARMCPVLLKKAVRLLAFFTVMIFSNSYESSLKLSSH